MPDQNFANSTASAAALAPDGDWRAWFEEAEARLAGGDTAASEALFQQVIAAAPKHLPAYIGASRCARQRGDRAVSLAFYEAAAVTHPTHAGVHMERAADLTALKRLDEAAAVYQSVIEMAPRNMQARLGLGGCARQRGDRAAAMAIFRDAAAAVPDNPWPLVEVAAEHRAAEQWDEAEAVYGQVLLIARDNVQAWLGLGICARRRGNRRLSFALFQAGALAAPGEPWALLEAAADLRELGELTAAEQIYRQALERAPGNAQAHLGLAGCARRRGDRAAAIRLVRAAIEVAPRDPWPLLDLAADLQEAGGAGEAEEIAKRALGLAPLLPQAHIAVALCARRRGDRSASVAVLREGVAAVPGDPWLRIELAADLRELGQLDEAEAQCRQVLAVAPGNVQAHLGLGAAVRKRGDRRAAMAIYQAAVAAVPGDPWPRIELAAELREHQQIDQAEAMYREALVLAPGNVQALLGLGFCARARGDRALALQSFEAAAEADPNDVAPWLEIAVEQREAGDADAAIATAKRILARHRDNFHALLSIGVSERYAGRHDAAYAAFGRAREANPAHAEPLVEMAVAARALGRQAECDGLLTGAVELDPRNVSAIVRLAEQAAMMQNHERALALYQNAATEQPGQLAFRLGAAEASAALGRIDEALALLAELDAERGRLPAVRGRWISLSRQSGDYPAALEMARESAAALPRNMQLWSEWFHTEMVAGNDAGVAACLAAAPAATARDRAAVRRHQGQFAESCWRFEEAMVDYQAAMAANGQDAGLRQDLVRMHTLLLELEDARVQLRRFCAMTAHETRLRGKSLNISQTQYGQILDEYRLDTSVVEKIRPLLGMAPGAQVGGLTEIVRAHPDSTAAAVSLMMALRRSGTFDLLQSEASTFERLIPRGLMQYWDAEEPPADVARLMRSWDEVNPGLDHQVFSDRTAREFLKRHFPPAVLAAYRRGEYATQKSDIFRLAYLVVAGGAYADADDRCIGPLERIVPGDARLVVYQDDHMTLCNNFIACAPRHPVLIAALRGAVVAMLRGDRDTVWFSTGPALLTRAFTTVLAADGVVIEQTRVLSRRELAGAVAIHCGAAYKRTDRHWLNATFARQRGRKAAV